MTESYDAVIIGGGPGGSTVATVLARAGRRVILFEREKFPRFHVGESLLPYSLPIWEQLGVAEKIRERGFQQKYGAFFWNEQTGGTRPVVFQNAENDQHPMAYHVKRAEFDELLLRHSESCGAQVREETRVEEVLFEAGRAVGVRVRPASGQTQEVRARVVVDASGQEAMLSRKLGTRKFD
jgi:halogenation protein CepH